jgi:hypothetical protein
MASFYTVIKQRFDGAVTLCPSPFAELYMTEAPEDEDKPFCIVVPDEETRVTGGFAHTWHEESFAFWIIDTSQESADANAELVEAVFKDIGPDLTVDNITILYLEKDTRRFETLEGEEGLWAAVITYNAYYEEAR